MSGIILRGDCRVVLRTQPENHFHVCFTSPPYYGLRGYRIEPTIWGGDPACEHQFVDEEVTAEYRKGAGLEELSKEYRGGGKKWGDVPNLQATRGTCSSCGAWRGHLGLEPTWQLYVQHMVEVFREVRRVLRDDGTCWVNLGDSYASATQHGHNGNGSSGLTNGGAYQAEANDWAITPPKGATARAGRGRNRATRDASNSGKAAYAFDKVGSNRAQRGDGNDGIPYGALEQPNRRPQPGLKAKDLMGIPWRVALALQDDGWWLRQDIIWQKPNPMPESVEDRCTKSHEYIFLLSKSETYYFDNVAIMEEISGNAHPRKAAGAVVPAFTPKSSDRSSGVKSNHSFNAAMRDQPAAWVVDQPEEVDLLGQAIAPDAPRPPWGHRSAPAGAFGSGARAQAPDLAQSFRAIREERNKRSVWTVATQPFSEAHFATYPPALVEPGILAGSSEKGCCRGCGAPWRRVTAPSARYAALLGRSFHDHGNDAAAGMMQHRGVNAQNAMVESGIAGKELETIGWYPTCRCDGLQQLPALPQRPRRLQDELQLEHVNLRGTNLWRLACVPVHAAWRSLCAGAAALPVARCRVLDPFGGAATTALVADRLQRDSIVVELSDDYAKMGEERLAADALPLFNSAAE